MTVSDAENGKGRETTRRALVIHPAIKSPDETADLAESRLAEAVGLAEAIDLHVAVAEVVRLPKPRPATYLGAGVVERFAERIEDEAIGLAILDCPLSPVQQRNLEQAWKCKVIDRTALILEIFGERAQTAEGRLQVELAHLTYQRSRLVRSWTHLERQRGGLGFIGGPGETQLEIDRRLIGERIAKIKSELETVKKRRALQRKARKRVPYPVVALVGYTNAGKSTLFNRLTDAGVGAEDMLFATLDPTMRALDLPSGRRVILSDTVGFISDLPTMLVAAFRATLEEVVNAELILHVRDVSHPETERQQRSVESVLCDLGLEESVEAGLFEVLNKIDRLDPDARARLWTKMERGNRPAIPVSALTGEGCEALLQAIDRRIGASEWVVEIAVDVADGAAIAWLHRNGQVLDEHTKDTTAHMRVKLDPADLERFRTRYPGADVPDPAAGYA